MTLKGKIKASGGGGELSLAQAITWSLLNFLHFRCPSPSGGSRKVQYPNAWGEGGGTRQGTRCCREGGRAEPEQPTLTLHTASSLHGRGRNRAHPCKQLAARPCCSGTPKPNMLNCLRMRVKKQPPTSAGLWQVEAVGPRLASLAAKRLLKP